MKSSSFKPVAAVAAALVLAASGASASPEFQVNPGAIGESYAQFAANSISGTTSELLRITGPNTIVANSGWTQFTSFNDASTIPLDNDITGLRHTGGYNLYLTFSLAATLTSGTIGGLGSTYQLTSLNVSVYADPNRDTSFVAANSSGAGTEAAVSGGAGEDVLLATSTLLSGNAGLNFGFGAYLNAISLFEVTAIGQAFFAEPNPFYDLSLAGFNNSGGGVTINAANGLIAINNAVGIVDFQRQVPEPGTMALVGLAMLGAGVAARRRRA